MKSGVAPQVIKRCNSGWEHKMFTSNKISHLRKRRQLEGVYCTILKKTFFLISPPSLIETLKIRFHFQFILSFFFFFIPLQFSFKNKIVFPTHYFYQTNTFLQNKKQVLSFQNQRITTKKTRWCSRKDLSFSKNIANNTFTLVMKKKYQNKVATNTLLCYKTS